MASVLLKRGRGIFETDEEKAHTEKKVEQGEMQPQAKECQQPLEAGRSKEWILPQEFFPRGSRALTAP